MPYKDYEKQKENARQNYYKNKERVRIRNKTNAKARRAYNIAWLLEHPNYANNRRASNPEKYRSQERRRRARISPVRRKEIWRKSYNPQKEMARKKRLKMKYREKRRETHVLRKFNINKCIFLF